MPKLAYYPPNLNLMGELMPKVIFVEDDGTRHEVEGKSGASLMEIAIANNIDGIEAECGGSCMCATCHCFIAEEFGDVLPSIDSDEDEMLGFTAVDRRATSRLSCQIKLTDELDGLEVHLPSEQN